ncbi:hypothetical protein, partial [Deinococcus aerophilus]|uniref:hypothetical protein n=1 Tax=Deinococcus aerophilus TaxID=522488 RepID=UPI001E46CD03
AFPYVPSSVPYPLNGLGIFCRDFWSTTVYTPDGFEGWADSGGEATGEQEMPQIMPYALLSFCIGLSRVKKGLHLYIPALGKVELKSRGKEKPIVYIRY